MNHNFERIRVGRVVSPSNPFVAFAEASRVFRLEIIAALDAVREVAQAAVKSTVISVAIIRFVRQVHS